MASGDENEEKYDGPMMEALQGGLNRLQQRRGHLKATIAAKKREVAALRKKHIQALAPRRLHLRPSKVSGLIVSRMAPVGASTWV